MTVRDFYPWEIPQKELEQRGIKSNKLMEEWYMEEEFKIGDKVSIKNINCPILKDQYSEGTICEITDKDYEGFYEAKFPDGTHWWVGGRMCEINHIQQYESTSALDTQVGGGHYKDLKIQPVEYILANDIGFVEGSIIKYVTRWKDKNGVEDLKKARHLLDILIEEQS